MGLGLDALAHWEMAVLASIRGARGTPDERDAQITRSGMYAEYPAILGAYIELVTDSDDPEVRLEALKRVVFLVWHSFAVASVDSGISELSETTVREVMTLLEAGIERGMGDEELRLMLACYRDSFGYPFDYFGPVRSLDRFIRDVTSEDARRALAHHRFRNRGQLGAYWSTAVGGV